MSSHSPQSSHINISTKRNSVHAHTHPKASQPSPLKMVTTSSTAHHQHHPRDDVSYYFLPSESDLACQGWMTPTVIDDDDLMFGGKSLSEWYEEERMQAASPPEEERRGRQRVSISLSFYCMRTSSGHYGI